MIDREQELRTTELIGLADDGRMLLWQVGQVRPISEFETDGRWIKEGHYVIQWKGHAITVHCGNYMNGNVSVLFMCSCQRSISLPRAEVEAMLLAEVVPDPKIKADILRRLKEITKMMAAVNDTPHRQRGRIS